MADGLQNEKIVFIVQARMQSSRLPGKILLPLPMWSDKPMLLWIIEALKASKYDAEIYIATSRNSENDILENFCKAHSIQCYRGDEENVLSRFIQILKGKDYKAVVRLTADNPILDTTLLDMTITYHLQQDNDYTNTVSLPLGMNFEVIRAKSLEELNLSILTKADKEHVTLFIKNRDSYKKDNFNANVAANLKPFRLTVDYPSDLLVASSLLAFSLVNKNLTGIPLVQKIALEHPYLFEVNKLNVQKKQFENIASEIKYAKELLKSFELEKTLAILKKYEEENSI